MNVEILGVTKVKELLAKSDYLSPNINDNDREASWDGDVEVYKKAGNVHRKKDQIICVPVQVKGRCADRHPKVISFSVEVSDLNNFLNVGGTVFFVVYVDSEGERKTVYYKELLPYELKKLCKEACGQQTKSIRLIKFPTDKASISNVFLNFANDMKNQRAVAMADSLSLEDLMKDGSPPELSFGFIDVSKNPNKPFNYLFDNPLYLYHTGEHGILYPVEHIDKITAAKRVLENPVAIAGKVYYQRYAVVFEKESVTIAIGEGISIRNDEKAKETLITITPQGTLFERVRDLEFFIEALNNNGFSVNGVNIDLSCIPESERQAFLDADRAEQLTFMKRATEVFKQLHVKGELDLATLDEKSYKNLCMLMVSVLDGKEVPLKDTGRASGSVTIGNLKILVLALKDQKTGLYKVEDFYRNDHIAHFAAPNGDKTIIPIGTTISRDFMMQIDNLDFHEIIKELDDFQKSPDAYSYITEFLLDVIRAYDGAQECKQRNLLEGAKLIARWLFQNDESTSKAIHLLNELQIVKRERQLNEAEINQINEIIETETEREDILTGAYLLTDNQLSAERHFAKMEPDLQESFKQYPIYRFWKIKEEVKQGKKMLR